ncbi:MAG TPA: ABC transporter ATP-binding protein, partial [Dehalococcoidia bacterium]|nr:ABC transporter ATP-binding protein [Dehalococcoidia bacterium]
MSYWFDPSAPLPSDNAASPMRGVYRRILGYMALFWGGIATAVALAMASSLFVVLQPWPIKFAIDGVLVSSQLDLGPLGEFPTASDGEKLRAAAALAGAYFGVTVAGVVLGALSFYWIARTALYMIHGLRSRLMAHLRRLSLRFHAQQSLGDTIWRAINDARSVQEVMIFGVRTWSILILRLALMVALMAVLDWRLTLVALAALPLLFLTIHVLTGRIQSTSQESREHMARMTSLIEQTMGSIRAVQVFGREGPERQRFERTSLAFVQAQLRFRVAEQVLNVATIVITGLGTAAVLMYASYRVIDGPLTVGSLWIFVAYMQSLYQMMNEVMFVYGPFQDAVVGVGRVFQALDQVSDVEEARDAEPKPTFDQGIRLRSVWVEYAPGKPVLRGIDLEVCKGEKVAIVGETGSGKTTVLNLIPRLFDVSGGAVELDGRDVRRLRIADLRDLVSMVPQEPLLFSASVRENILYGRLDASPEEVEEAARLARADGFIQELPAKYETEVGDRGVRLSTGQQQRISIA